MKRQAPELQHSPASSPVSTPARPESPDQLSNPSSPARPDSPVSNSSFAVAEDGLEDPLEDILSDGDQADHEAETESIGIVEMDDSFMNGKILLLPVQDGDVEVPLCCLCIQPALLGEPLTSHLEFKLRLNPILSHDENSFGIVFNYAQSDASFQMVCDTCLVSRHDSAEGQDVSQGFQAYIK